MKEIGRLQFAGLSRAEIIDLKRTMPEGLLESYERTLSEDEAGALDPQTVSAIVTLGLAGLSVLGAWLLKNRKNGEINVEQVLPDGSRKTIHVKLTESMSDAEAVTALTQGMGAPAGNERS